MWRAFWDAAFAIASILLCVFFGCALGNLLRGLPLDANGWFSLALFTDFSARMPVGILDWYTVLVGMYALVTLAMHAGAYLCWKTDGEVGERSRRFALGAGIVVAATWPVMTVASVRLNPLMFEHFVSRPLAWGCAALALAGLVSVFAGLRRGSHRRAFFGSSAFLLGLMAATAVSIYPIMLRGIGDGVSMLATEASNDAQGLRTATGWWLVGIPLVVVYFAIQFRVHAGKASAPHEGEGY
jgi:cytochrome d ubiquinol oxidase subunit II